MTKLGLAVATTIVAAVAAGAVEFPHALEPGRSEANGITLNMLVDQGSGAVPPDWYSGQPTVQSSPSDGRVTVRANRRAGLLLVTRPLPVFGDRRYVFLVRAGTATRGHVGFAVAHSHLGAYADTVELPPGSPTMLRLRFRTREARPVTFVLFGPAHARVTVYSARLVALPS